jgi:hypothetical protein
MNKRIRNKKIKKRYNYGLQLLSDYCELPVKTIIEEIGKDLWVIASDLNEMDNDLIPYLDTVSMSLMGKYKTGWAGRE